MRRIPGIVGASVVGIAGLTVGCSSTAPTATSGASAPTESTVESSTSTTTSTTSSLSPAASSTSTTTSSSATVWLAGNIQFESPQKYGYLIRFTVNNPSITKELGAPGQVRAKFNYTGTLEVKTTPADRDGPAVGDLGAFFYYPSIPDVCPGGSTIDGEEVCRMASAGMVGDDITFEQTPVPAGAQLRDTWSGSSTTDYFPEDRFDRLGEVLKDEPAFVVITSRYGANGFQTCEGFGAGMGYSVLGVFDLRNSEQLAIEQFSSEPTTSQRPDCTMQSTPDFVSHGRDARF